VAIILLKNLVFSMNKSFKNFIIIFLFGISSGLPISLILSTIKPLLVDKGFDLKTIGLFSLVSIPYSLKFIISPFIDSKALPILTRIFGQRKSWIIFSQALLAIFISSFGIIQISNSLFFIACFAILIAIASATQDIVIDAYRIEITSAENQGLAASFYVYGYRLGMLISGALALALAEKISWQAVYILMAVFMCCCFITTLVANESRKNWQPKKYKFAQWYRNFIIEPFVDFSRHNNWLLILIFIILFKLTDIFAGNLTLPFLMEIGFTKIEIATITKTFGLFATLFGVLIGGILVKKIGLIKSLWIAIFMQAVSNLAFSYLALKGKDNGLLYLVIFIENSSGGIGDSVFVAYLSSLCNIAFSATQYSLLSSLASFSRSFLAASAGIFAQSLGWFGFFIFSTILALPCFILLFIITFNKNLKKT